MGITLTIKKDLSERLDNVAKVTKQSKSSLANQAIDEFLTVQEWHIEAINEGIRAAEAGDVVSHEKALIELKRWGQRAS